MALFALGVILVSLKGPGTQSYPIFMSILDRNAIIFCRQSYHPLLHAASLLSLLTPAPMVPAKPDVKAINEISSMQVFFRLHRNTAVVVNPLDSVATLKERIHDKEGIPVHNKRLLFAGKPLDDNSQTLKE